MGGGGGVALGGLYEGGVGGGGGVASLPLCLVLPQDFCLQTEIGRREVMGELTYQTHIIIPTSMDEESPFPSLGLYDE